MNEEQLRKVLKLEQSRGYANTSVFGGLDKFLHHLPANFPKRLPLPSDSYDSLNPIQRETYITKLLKLISSPGRATAKPASATITVSLDSPINILKSVTPKLLIKFNRLGITSIRDVIHYFPRRHNDYSKTMPISQLEVDEEQTIIAKVWQTVAKRSSRGMRNTEAIVSDNTGTVRVIWFNQPYLVKQLQPGTKIAVSGKVGLYKGWKVFQSPEYEILKSGDLIHTGRLVPVYPSTEGLYGRQIRRVISEALNFSSLLIQDFLPETLRKRADLMELSKAVYQAHYPDNDSQLQAARYRLAFNELFIMQLGLLDRKLNQHGREQGMSISTNPDHLSRFLKSLPFQLTQAQNSALNQIISDISQSTPMRRLLQGDVGSGKTIVAIAAIQAAVTSGFQTAFMAPTEILAEQHFKNISRLFDSDDSASIFPTDPSSSVSPVNIGLLTGKMAAGEKRKMHRDITDGEIDVVIGTQAIIQSKVHFHNLGLVVVDEQHRFGVMQRAALREKGTLPHMLVMSATPIPRTLALTMYGDLDITLIDELPPGRLEIKTRWLGPGQRQNGYNFVRQQIKLGRQAFVICPLVEESENISARAATVEFERLSRDIFSDLKLGLLHGRMSGKAKEEVMQSFYGGETDILVSTSVIEVGIDVPNATVILIEGADRFGLSQLHQFRGRVWRSSHQSYCLLMADNPSIVGQERLAIMENTFNGFRLAEEDLRLRGPGAFFGTRQSGLPDLKMARLSDVFILEKARSLALELMESDPQLQKPEHKALAEEVQRFWIHVND